MATVEEFISNAREWVDVPYHHQQRSRHGADCIGFILGALLEIGVDYTGTDLMSRTRYANGRVLQDRVEAICGAPLDVVEPGCLLVFWNNAITKAAHHVAILTDANTILHCELPGFGAGKVVEVSYTPALQRKLVAAYRIPLEAN